MRRSSPLDRPCVPAHWNGIHAGLLLICGSLVALTAHAAEVRTLLGTGQKGHSGDGGPASSAACFEPFGLVVGPDGALHVCETKSHVIRRVDLKSNVVTTVAGTPGKSGYAGDGGPATSAKLNEPYEVRFDAQGRMVFVEMVNHLVRRVDVKTGIISTVAGTGKKGDSGDGGPAAAATMNQPHSIALSAEGNIYICDILNHRVRRVDAKSGNIENFGGTGEKKSPKDGDPLAGTPLFGPRALDFTAQGDLILALREGNAIFRIDMQQRSLHHLAGTGKSGYTGDGGPAKLAQVAGPKGVSVATNGDIYFADTESHTIRVIRLKSGIMETVVGDGKQGDGPDGDPRKCRLNRPHGVFVDSLGVVYIGDSSNHRVRVLRP